MASVFRLVALIPPGSVQSEIGRLQGELFRRFGWVSSQALPPLIPVRFIGPPGSDRALLDRLDAVAKAPWRMTTRRLAWIEGHLFLGIDSNGAWAALREEARAGPGDQPPGLFPVAEGFFLGCGEASTDRETAAATDSPAPAFSSCAIAVMEIESPCPLAEWWREVYWEVREQKPFRGRRES